MYETIQTNVCDLCAYKDYCYQEYNGVDMCENFELSVADPPPEEEYLTDLNYRQRYYQETMLEGDDEY